MASNGIHHRVGDLSALCQLVRVRFVPVNDLSSAHTFLLYTRLLSSGAGRKVQS